jgi:hypothetical protein
MQTFLAVILGGLTFMEAPSMQLLAQAAPPPPTFWSWAPTPPMGWNSYDAFGDSVTEDEVMANARYVQEKLLSHGWNYVVVDFRWYDPQADSGDRQNRLNAVLTADAYGRLLPSPNRFPSSSSGGGFKPLAERIHALGLKFGIHIMRGIPRQAVRSNTRIEGSAFTAAEAANTNSVCEWCPDMFGVNGATPAGQAWYDSIIRQYAAWGVDFVKADDLSHPYSGAEIEAMRKAIDRSGRPIVFSLSPGETPVEQAEHVAARANLWRISADFWDNWKSLNRQFELVARWQGHGGPGRWPDADMIPFGRIGKRCADAKGEHWTHFTKDEQVTLMTLWTMAPSPLMLGMNLPENDAWTLGLLTNDDVLTVNQDPLGEQGRRVTRNGPLEVWVKPLADGSKAVALFNRGETVAGVSALWTALGLEGKQRARDLWSRKDAGEFENSYTTDVPPHGALLVRISPATANP